MTNSLKQNGVPIKCLLIDDDIDDQEIFSIAVQELGEPIDCIFEDSGVKALEKLNGDRSFLPNYIFLDINMPRMNGVECLIEIKKLNHLNHVPIFMFSTSAEPDIVAKTKEFGASDFIVKPPSISGLSKLLAQIFNSNESSAQ
jgi:CheY-like chemotaxis protein